MELNPNHPTTAALRDQWHKIAAIFLHKLGGEVLLTEKDIAAAIEPMQGKIIAAIGEGDAIRFKIVTEEQARELMRADRRQQA